MWEGIEHRGIHHRTIVHMQYALCTEHMHCVVIKMRLKYFTKELMSPPLIPKTRIAQNVRWHRSKYMSSCGFHILYIEYDERYMNDALSSRIHRWIANCILHSAYTQFHMNWWNVQSIWSALICSILPLFTV